MPKGSFNKVEIPRRFLKIGVLKTYIIDVRLGSKWSIWNSKRKQRLINSLKFAYYYNQNFETVPENGPDTKFFLSTFSRISDEYRYLEAAFLKSKTDSKRFDEFLFWRKKFVLF